MGGLIIIGVTVATILIALIIVTAIEYCDITEDKDNMIKLRFSAFERFYRMNPEGWELYNGYVAKKVTIDDSSAFIHWSHTERIECYFGFKDWLKYRKWNEKRKKRKINQNLTDKETELLKAVQADIDAYKEKNKIDWTEHLNTWKTAYDEIKKNTSGE